MSPVIDVVAPRLLAPALMVAAALIVKGYTDVGEGFSAEDADGDRCLGARERLLRPLDVTRDLIEESRLDAILQRHVALGGMPVRSRGQRSRRQR